MGTVILKNVQPINEDWILEQWSSIVVNLFFDVRIVILELIFLD